MDAEIACILVALVLGWVLRGWFKRRKAKQHQMSVFPPDRKSFKVIEVHDEIPF